METTLSTASLFRSSCLPKMETKIQRLDPGGIPFLVCPLFSVSQLPEMGGSALVIIPMIVARGKDVAICIDGCHALLDGADL